VRGENAAKTRSRINETKTQNGAKTQQAELQERRENAPKEPLQRNHEGRVEALASMACYRPLGAYKGPDGIKFDSRQGWADMPIRLKCGQCIGCRIERARSWTIRLLHEGQMHDRNAFITLTYDDEHLPADGSLDVEHWKKFAKRVRKRLGKMRFYHIGEYGPSTRRPHYHACIFGQDFQNPELPWQQQDKKGFVWRSPILEELWTQGNSTIGPFNEQTASYCAKYVISKPKGEHAESYYERLDPSTGEVWAVKPEYSTMSLKPGIGAKWLEKYKNDVYPDDGIVHDNKHYRPPKYYDDLVERDDPELLEKLKSKRKSHIKTNASNNTPQRLETRERVKEKLATTFKKHQL